jgi:hypothetical protein
VLIFFSDTRSQSRRSSAEERGICNPQVVGSNPTGGSMSLSHKLSISSQFPTRYFSLPMRGIFCRASCLLICCSTSGTKKNHLPIFLGTHFWSLDAACKLRYPLNRHPDWGVLKWEQTGMGYGFCENRNPTEQKPST